MDAIESFEMDHPCSLDGRIKVVKDFLHIIDVPARSASDSHLAYPPRVRVSSNGSATTWNSSSYTTYPTLSSRMMLIGYPYRSRMPLRRCIRAMCWTAVSRSQDMARF